MEHADVAQIVNFRGAEDYDELKVQVKDFDATRKAMGNYVSLSTPSRRTIQNHRSSEEKSPMIWSLRSISSLSRYLSYQ